MGPRRSKRRVRLVAGGPGADGLLLPAPLLVAADPVAPLSGLSGRCGSGARDLSGGIRRVSDDPRGWPAPGVWPGNRGGKIRSLSESHDAGEESPNAGITMSMVVDSGNRFERAGPHLRCRH